MDLNSIYKKVVDDLNQYIQNHTEKNFNTEDFAPIYKTKHSYNITLEDWNILQQYLSNLNSDLNSQDAYINNLTVTLKTLLDYIKDTFYTKAEVNNIKTDAMSYTDTQVETHFNKAQSNAFAYVDAQILKHTNEVLGGVDERGDTLIELFNLILNNKSIIDTLEDASIRTYYNNTDTEIIQTMERAFDYTFDAENISRIVLNIPRELTQGYLSAFSIRIGLNVPTIEIVNGSEYPILYTLNGMQRKPKYLAFRNNQTLNGAFMFDGINIYCYLKELRNESELE